MSSDTDSGRSFRLPVTTEPPTNSDVHDDHDDDDSTPAGATTDDEPLPQWLITLLRNETPLMRFGH